MILNLILFGVAALLFSTVIRGAPFLPTRHAAVARMVVLAQLTPGARAADIGSGDGRIVIALARAGAEAYGFEINPILVWWSRYKIWKAGLNGRAFIQWGSFWGKNFAEFEAVTVFGISRIMPELERKLQDELRPGARVVSYVFAFPTWPREQKEGAISVYRKT
ncbi:MAG: hypothetical protein A2846_00965 [Candidatus Doudnabacteria bacterium RIFCSPHIGHO2_01_FULL_49_9]|uniref:Methyltransferase domain-containing protein n=1 Tax=Candidatus Doudnabacteria bacterium RIFCSPHIGHO2_01_FULL_49_9 TaxID=1817827 RepID=A0A1F5P4B5_9BACT|nr:MAG: hypothetical protein A2846_00965 [Candidatus Doudnabacteria bacterium RIFCSPHIGHO2_01_FULL_49_9]